MARLRTYENDTVLTDGDRILSTDAAGGLNTTTNITLADLKAFVESGVDVTLTTPAGVMPFVDFDGNNVHGAAVYVTATSFNTEINFYNVDPGDAEALDEINLGIFNIVNAGDGWYMDLVQYIGKYDYTSFVGQPFSFLSIDSGDTRITGTLGEIDTIDNQTYRVVGGNRIVRYAITRTGVIADTWDLLVSATNNATTFTFTSEAEIDRLNLRAANLTINDDLTVIKDVTVSGDFTLSGAADITGNTNIDGTLDILGDTTIGDANSDPAVISDLTVSGDAVVDGVVHVDGNSGGITFGDRVDPDVSFTTDGDNLTIGGGGNITIEDDPDESESLFIRRTTDISGPLRVDSSLALRGASNKTITVENNIPIVRVQGNTHESGIPSGGTLTEIQIGENYYFIPETQGSVAALLPGVTEDLLGYLAANDTDTFFYGTEGIGVANYLSTVDISSVDQLPITTIAIGDLSFVLANTNSDRSDFNTIWEARDNANINGRLFFVDSVNPFDFSAAASGDPVSGTVYEVLAYSESTGVVNFARLGVGTLNLATPEVKLNAIPSLGVGEANEEIVYIGADKTLHSRSVNFVGTRTAARYTRGDNNAVQTLSAIEFTGNHNIDSLGSQLGMPVIDISGRYQTGALQTAAFSAEVFTLYLLGGVAADTAITLPSSPSAGDSMKFVNFDTDDDNGQWVLTPAAGDRIMGADENATMDIAANAAFELIYANDAQGWVII